jgi:cytoskeletal protein CcmA (bactofilin family)
MALNDKILNWPEAAQANARRTILAADLEIDGDVTSDGPVDIHGKIVGSACAPEVLVAATGRIEGTASAHDLSILGIVSGSVSARQIQLSPSAVVHADVLHERIVIEAGAELEGRLQRVP